MLAAHITAKTDLKLLDITLMGGGWGGFKRISPKSGSPLYFLKKVSVNKNVHKIDQTDLGLMGDLCSKLT